MALAAATDRTWEAGVEDEPRSGIASVDDLFQQEYAHMLRLAYFVIGSAEVAQDLVQEAFVKVSRRWERIEDPAAYLRTTVQNTCRSHLRRREVERRLRPERRADFLADSPDELSDALAKLSARQRTALVLRFYDDLPEEQIATVLGVRPATVRSIVHRALAQLRKAIPQ